MNEQNGGDVDSRESASARGERRKAIEQERRVFLETGQLPRLAGSNEHTRDVPAPNSRRARRLAEQGAGVSRTGGTEGRGASRIPRPSRSPEEAFPVPDGPSSVSSGRGTAEAPTGDDTAGSGVRTRVLQRGAQRVERPTTTLPTIQAPRRLATPDALPPVPSPSAPPPSWQESIHRAGETGATREVRRADPAPSSQGTTLGAGVPARRRGRRVTLVLVGLLLVALVAAGSVWALRRHGASTSDTAAAVVPQRTLMVVLDDGSDNLLAAALLASDHQGAVSVLVPSGLLVDVPGAGRRPLSAALGASDEAPAKALSDALQVRIDGTWRLTLTGLEQLVDAAGGVLLDVDAPVTAGDVSVAMGPGQRLTGKQASVLASTLLEGELEERRLARFQSVLAGVLAVLPEGESLIVERLAAVGEDSAVVPETYGVGPLLNALRLQAQAGGISGTVLPVRTLPAGDSSVYGLDEAGAAALVELQLAGARFPVPPGGVVKVLVQNGVGEPGLGEAARDRLVGAGMRYVAGGNASTFGRERTAVLVASNSGDDRAKGVRAAVALGIPGDAVAVNVLGTTLADVVVVLGQDFADSVIDSGVETTSATETGASAEAATGEEFTGEVVLPVRTDAAGT